jgi:predicted N-acetyltransferase YhbS
MTAAPSGAEIGRSAGYVTVVPSEIEAERIAPALRKSLPHYPLPVLRLARLAVDELFRRKGIGSELLYSVFQLALAMARDFGCTGILVDAKPGAESYYAQYGFVPVETMETIPARAETPMFLAIGKVEAAGKKGAA